MNYDDVINNPVSVEMQELLDAAAAGLVLYTYTTYTSDSTLQTGTITYISIGDDNARWEGLTPMPFDDDTPAREAAALKASIQQGIAEAKGGLVETAISALHRQHSYNGRPNRFVPE